VRDDEAASKWTPVDAPGPARSRAEGESGFFPGPPPASRTAARTRAEGEGGFFLSLLAADGRLLARARPVMDDETKLDLVEFEMA